MDADSKTSKEQKMSDQPAFPHTRVFSDTPNDLMHQNLPMSGMTLRDYFAAKAMQGAFSNETVMKVAAQQGGMAAFIADFAYDMADAMLKQREKTA